MNVEKAPYIFIAAMDVDPEKEALFHGDLCGKVPLVDFNALTDQIIQMESMP